MSVVFCHADNNVAVITLFMRTRCLSFISLFCIAVLQPSALMAQRIIEYESGMGTRDPGNADIWILYNHVVAFHDGMTLITDSASFDTKNNVFVAYRNVVIHFTDTTTLYGSSAIYDGTTRIADVWGDTVTLVDGKTILKTDIISYDRNSSTASYYHWGHTVHVGDTMDSDKGFYHSDTRDLFLFDNVALFNANSRLLTDTLYYNTRTSLAQFVSPTDIFSDSSTVYSENGTYNTNTHLACSYKATRLTNREKWLTADTLYFNDKTEHGEAWGNVTIVDTLNNVICKGEYGLTDQERHASLVTDSALIVLIDKGDSAFMHADSIWAFNNDDKEFESAKAYRTVRVYRYDAQAVCDSLFYSAKDSVLYLYQNPVVWYDNYQCTADTIICHFDSGGVRLVNLRANIMAVEKVDRLKFNQVKGKNADVYCKDSEPLYADVLGSARMVYYVLDETEGNHRELIGVNAGMGSDMRIYFKNRKPTRFATYGTPDMKMYPPDELPEEEKSLPGFKWQEEIRPLSPADVFVRKSQD